MQDIHSIGGAGGRIFGGGDRRLRPHHQNQALKCPRCDSLNTKFCYYNNYNLSQPRHFCKSCRRYWTKGGVLRNVPVGGGCRKAKRSKPKQSPADAPSREKKSNSHSSSESSSLTATTATANTTTAATEATASFSFPESRFFVPQSANPNFEQNGTTTLLDNASDGGGVIFPEIGSFTSLMTASNDQTVLNFSVSEVSPYKLSHHQQDQEQIQQNHHQQQWQLSKMTSVNDEMKMQEIAAGFLDQNGPVDLSGLQNRSSNGGFAPLDWQSTGGGDDQGLFDLTGTVDQAYWSQNQWSDHDHSLYLP